MFKFRGEARLRFVLGLKIYEWRRSNSLVIIWVSSNPVFCCKVGVTTRETIVILRERERKKKIKKRHRQAGRIERGKKTDTTIDRQMKQIINR